MQQITLTGAATQLRPEVRAEMRWNFRHLYADIVGFGILSGSTLTFLAVYLTRLGASNSQVGWLTAGPALVSLLVTLPAGQWLGRRQLPQAVFWTSVLNRLIYPLLIPLLLVVSPGWQMNAILLLVVLTAAPGAALAIGFNALFAEAVPESWRGTVAGRRNALMALSILASSLLCGQLLLRLPFTEGYLVVFAIGVVGAGFSSYHLARIRLFETASSRSQNELPFGDAGRLGRAHMLPDMPLQRTFALRALTRVQDIGAGTMLAPLRQGFAPFLLALSAFHFAQYFAIPLFPLFWVRTLTISDAEISVLNVVFYVCMLVAAPRLGHLTTRFGNRRLVVVGSILLAGYPLVTALSHGMVMLTAAAILGGANWAILGGALSNRLLERVPEGDRPRHLALYNLALNAAVLGGSLAGPLVADQIGLRQALFAAASLRLAAALLLARRG